MRFDAIIRVSKVGYRDTTLQSDKEQLAAVRAWAAANGHEIVEVHYERDVSGKTTNRKALKAAKARAMSGEVDGLVAAYLSRFSRNAKEGLELVSDLLDAGRQFVALDMAGIDFRTGTGEQMLTMMLGQARAEWRARQDTFNHYRAKAITNGKHLTERFGYRKGADGVLIADPVESPIVPMIFERRAGIVAKPDGSTGAWSWTELADWLNAEGIKPHTFSNRKDGAATKRTPATAWRHSAVKALVESRTYLGEAWSGEHVTHGAHVALVSPSLFARCEALRDLRNRRGAEEYVLSGIAKCECGAKMRGCTDEGRKGKRYRYYKCTGRKCTRKIRADKLEPAAFEFFADTTRGLRAYSVERTGNVDAAMAHVADMEALEAQAGADLELRQASRTAYLAAVTEAAERTRNARKRLTEERQAITGVSASDEDLAGWSTLGVDTRRRFLAEAFDAIMVSIDRTQWVPIGRGELTDVESLRGRFLAVA